VDERAALDAAVARGQVGPDVAAGAGVTRVAALGDGAADGRRASAAGVAGVGGPGERRGGTRGAGHGSRRLVGVDAAAVTAGAAGLGAAVDVLVALDGSGRVGVAEGVAELAGVGIAADRRGLEAEGDLGAGVAGAPGVTRVAGLRRRAADGRRAGTAGVAGVGGRRLSSGRARVPGLRERSDGEA